MTADQFRRLALALPGAIESAHMGHPDFRAHGRIFATLHTGDRTGMVKVTPAEQAELIRQHKNMFEPSPGAWGRQGSTTVHLAEADAAVIRGALTMAWEASARKPARKPARRRVSNA